MAWIKQSDSTLPTSSHYRFLSDVLTTVDELVSKAVSRGVALEDTIQVVDSVARTALLLRVLAETINLNDDKTAQWVQLTAIAIEKILARFDPPDAIVRFDPPDELSWLED